VSLITPTVPSYNRTQQGLLEDIHDMVSDEIEHASTIRLMVLRLLGKNSPDAPHRTWIAFFSKTPRSGFRAMDTEDKCIASTKCRNFGEPHRFNGYKCLACPTRYRSPSKEQL
ncbi:hypothetical protein EPUL_006450, partial [Erysiphe pulchra]